MKHEFEQTKNVEEIHKGFSEEMCIYFWCWRKKKRRFNYTIIENWQKFSNDWLKQNWHSVYESFIFSWELCIKWISKITKYLFKKKFQKKSKRKKFVIAKLLKCVIFHLSLRFRLQFNIKCGLFSQEKLNK